MWLFLILKIYAKFYKALVFAEIPRQIKRKIFQTAMSCHVLWLPGHKVNSKNWS